MNICKLYEDILTERLEKYLKTDSNVLIVMQGFPYPVYEAIQNIGINHFIGKKFTEYINCNEFDDTYGKQLMASLISSTGTTWIFYEEFIEISRRVNDISGFYSGEIVLLKNNLFDEFYPIPTPCDYISLLKEDNNTDSKTSYYYAECKMIGETAFFSYVNSHYDIDIGINLIEINMFESSPVIGASDDSYIAISVSSLDIIKHQLQLGQLHDCGYVVTERSDILDKELGILNYLGAMLNVVICIEDQDKKRTLNANKYLPIFQKYWGEENEFRSNKFYNHPETSTDTIEISQGEIVTNIISQCKNAEDEKPFSDLIVTAPTGFGKSVLFQVPGIYLHEKRNAITIVVCPLLALMADQVNGLIEKGINYATYINSTISFDERQERMNGIKNGKYSIIYLSPELLLSTDIQTLVGDRDIGLIVIDEAHLVTSWGRDFRVDYWFLGDYLEKIRHGGYYYTGRKMNVPVLCLTATAVFGGNDDVITELENSLNLTVNSEQLYIGYVKRDNIEFVIRHPKKDRRSDKDIKAELTVKEIERNIGNSQKTIVYFPYTSQIGDVENKIKINPSIYDHVVKYHGGEFISSIEKDYAYNSFRNNEKIIMLATKAFGMGVDISDVNEVYHFAPTGTLADYVQEIGRTARTLDLGYAVTDYLPTDMRYARTLWGLSGIKHYQLQEMMKKLYELYENKGNRRNLLISPETFNYLYGDNADLENKVKSGFMLLSTDLRTKYHFRVITVRAKSMYSKQFIMLSDRIEEEFLRKYGQYCTLMEDVKPRNEHDRYGQPMTTHKIGNVYEIDFAELWENDFSETTFAQFKYNFFNGKLFNFGEDSVIPNTKLIITYSRDYDDIAEDFIKLAEAIQNTFKEIKQNYGGREFKMTDFSKSFRTYYDKSIKETYINKLIDLFCYDRVSPDDPPLENWKFIYRKRSESKNEITYCIRDKYAGIDRKLKIYFNNARPNSSDNTYVTYIPLPHGKRTGASEYQLLVSMLQLFDIASYEFVGGRNPEIFVRINDPLKLKRLSNSENRYTNRLVTDIAERHKRAILIMQKFMLGNFSNAERWSIIEEYFLGHDENVEVLLESPQHKPEERKDEIKSSKKFKVDIISGTNFAEDYASWEDASAIDNIDGFIDNNIIIPDIYNAKIVIAGNELSALYVWKQKKIVIMDDYVSPEIISEAEKSNWYIANFGNINYKHISDKLEEK